MLSCVQMERGSLSLSLSPLMAPWGEAAVLGPRRWGGARKRPCGGWRLRYHIHLCLCPDIFEIVCSWNIISQLLFLANSDFFILSSTCCRKKCASFNMEYSNWGVFTPQMTQRWNKSKARDERFCLPTPSSSSVSHVDGEDETFRGSAAQVEAGMLTCLS